MQSVTAKATDEGSRKNYRRTSSSVDQEQSDFSLDLWKKAFRDACERLCPVRAGGHECGCLPLLSRLVCPSTQIFSLLCCFDDKIFFSSKYMNCELYLKIFNIMFCSVFCIIGHLSICRVMCLGHGAICG